MQLIFDVALLVNYILLFFHQSLHPYKFLTLLAVYFTDMNNFAWRHTSPFVINIVRINLTSLYHKNWIVCQYTLQ